MKTIIITLFTTYVLFAQSYSVLSVIGDVKYQPGVEESWIKLNTGTQLGMDATISTGDNSSVRIKSENNTFSMGEQSAVLLKNIKEMSIDDLLLALAMEDMINAPKKNGNGTSTNTAVYGTDESESENLTIESDGYGIKRLNGAMQLAENGMEESSVVVARETYRKYPDTKSIPYYRIFFADILYDKGLYEEAFEEYDEIVKLDLNESERTKVDENVEQIKKYLLSN